RVPRTHAHARLRRPVAISTWVCRAWPSSKGNRTACLRYAPSRVLGPGVFESRLVGGKPGQPVAQRGGGGAPIDLLGPVEIADAPRQADRDHVGFIRVGW